MFFQNYVWRIHVYFPNSGYTKRIDVYVSFICFYCWSFLFIIENQSCNFYFPIAYELRISYFYIKIKTFYNALNSEFTKIQSDLPADSFFRLGLSLLPSNSMTCISIIAAAHLARWIYLYNSKYIKSLFISNS